MNMMLDIKTERLSLNIFYWQIEPIFINSFFLSVSLFLCYSLVFFNFYIVEPIDLLE